MAENSQKKNWRGSHNNNKYNLKIEQLSMLISTNYFEIDGHLLSSLLFIKINSGTKKENANKINNVYIYRFLYYLLARSFKNSQLSKVYHLLQGLHYYCLWKPPESLFLLFMKERHTPPPFIKIMNSTLYDAQNKYHDIKYISFEILDL